MLKQYVVVGGSGFIGSQLVAHLACQDNVRKVYVLDRVPTSAWSGKIAYRYADIDKPLSVDLHNSIDGVFHLAALCKEPGYQWDEYFRTNHVGTRHVAEWAERMNIPSMVFTSTAMVFKAGPDRRTEDDLIDADTAYGISKALAEEALHGWQARGPNRTLGVVRPGAVFGKGCGGNFVNLHRSIQAGYFAYIGKSDTVKSCIYVKDLVRLLVHLMERPCSISEVATAHGAYPDATSIQLICEAFCDVFGWKRTIPTIPLEAALAAASPFQLLNDLGFKNPIHRRRIEKLYYSTHLGADRLAELGFRLKYSVADALRDWRDDCAPAAPY